jgi:cob(I)alamin adenosyltransferase
VKIYTGSGDQGKTSLFSGERVTKGDIRIEAYGEVDELCSILGALIAHLPNDQNHLRHELKRIQSDLFQVGACLATTLDSPAASSIEKVQPDQIHFLENAIDRMDAQLPALHDFILPGGHVTAAWAHIARTVCRRTERQVVRFLDSADRSQKSGPLERLQVYLNRLSDYLFVLARYCNQQMGVSENRWKK